MGIADEDAGGGCEVMCSNLRSEMGIEVEIRVDVQVGYGRDNE